MKKILENRWTVVGLCFLMVMISLGFASSTKSLFPDEITKEIGVERMIAQNGKGVHCLLAVYMLVQKALFK